MKIMFLLFLIVSVYAGEGSLKKEHKQNKLSQKQLYKLQKTVKQDPQNVEDRLRLMSYYISVNDKDQVKTLAGQIFKINPEESRAKAFLKKYNIVPDLPRKTKRIDARKHKNDAFYTLHMYAQHGEYRLFLNLFKIMDKQSISFPKEILMEAIDASLELKQYKMAQHIVENYSLPHTKNYKKFVKLLQKKVASF